MIKQQGNRFLLETENTSYLFRINEAGHPEHLHYGRKIQLADEEALCFKQHILKGNTVAYSKEHPAYTMEMACLEVSAPGKGDMRENFAELTFADGSSTCDFLFEKAEILEAKPKLSGLPSSYDEGKPVETLKLTLKEANYEVYLELLYSVFEECNVIARSARVINEEEEMVTVNRLMSLQLDLDDDEYNFTTFHGAWTREMNRYDQRCRPGILVSDSKTGTSGNHANPFVMLSRPDTTEEAGECFGFNLIYSGNHYEAAEVGIAERVRFLTGISPWNFGWKLEKGEAFQSPEAVMTFSADGFGTMSHNMHHFVREHIVRGSWKKKERPVLVNSWEAAYFNFTEGRLLAMAKEAKKVGVELFVLDDGWFGERDSDSKSLGDWYHNPKKLPQGIKGLSDKIHDMGLDFGIWVEPEMVNEDSECYRNHPDWAMKIPSRQQSLGRNQMILDLTKKEVREYVINAMRNVFSAGGVDYVKWDMNRHFSDYYSDGLPAQCQREVAHRYILGLYEIMDTLTKEFPDILFEGCASGGNRFDLGILCYMPQIWASDDTDAYARAGIQTGYSYGYPMSVITAHVSDCPNHQTLRNTSLDTRFHVACFGILGYECNIAEMKPWEKEAVKKQIDLYKSHRKELQFGDYYRIQSGKDGIYRWLTASRDKKTAVGILLKGLSKPNQSDVKFRTRGLADEKLYHFYNLPLKHNIKEFGGLVNAVSPVRLKQDSLLHNLAATVVKLDGAKEDYRAFGSLLNHSGIKLKQPFSGAGFDDQIRLSRDFDSELYFMEEELPVAKEEE